MYALQLIPTACHKHGCNLDFESNYLTVTVEIDRQYLGYRLRQSAHVSPPYTRALDDSCGLPRIGISMHHTSGQLTKKVLQRGRSESDHHLRHASHVAPVLSTRGSKDHRGQLIRTGDSQVCQQMVQVRSQTLSGTRHYWLDVARSSARLEISPQPQSGWLRWVRIRARRRLGAA